MIPLDIQAYPRTWHSRRFDREDAAVPPRELGDDRNDLRI